MPAFKLLPLVPLSTPDSTTLPTVSMPVINNVAPLATVTAAVFDTRSGAPSVRTPPSTFTVFAAAVPTSCALPLLVSVPRPRLASTDAPLCSV